MRSELVKGHLEALVLSILADGARHGYAVMEALADRTAGEIVVEGGTLYPLLHKLEEGGAVKSKWSETGGRRRRTYSITAKGRRTLAGHRTAWAEMVRTIGSVLASDGRA